MPKQRIPREMVVDAAFSIAREQGTEQVLVKNIAARLGCSVQPIYSYCRNMEDLRNAVMQRACEVVRREVAAYIESNAQVKPAAPAGQTAPIEAAAPAGQTAPIEAAAPAGQTAPIGAAAPAEPAVSAGPAPHASPAAKIDSAAHADPAGRFRSTGRAWLHVARHEPQLFKLFLACPRQEVASWDALYRTEADPAVAASIAKGLGLDADAAQRLYLQMLVYTVGLGTIFAMTEIPPEEIFARQEDAYEAFFRQAALRHAQKEE